VDRTFDRNHADNVLRHFRKRRFVRLALTIDRKVRLLITRNVRLFVRDLRHDDVDVALLMRGETNGER